MAQVHLRLCGVSLRYLRGLGIGVKAVEAHTAAPTRIERLPIVDTVAGANDRLTLFVRRIRKTDARREVVKVQILGITGTEAGCAISVAGEGQSAWQTCSYSWCSRRIACIGIGAIRIKEGEVVVLLQRRCDVIPAYAIGEGQ